MTDTETQIVRHDLGIETYEFYAGVPDARLRPYVARCEGYVAKTPGVMLRRELPGARVVCVISFGEPYRIIDPRAPEQPTVSRSFVAGLSDMYVMNESPGVTTGVQLDLTPLGAYRMLGAPMHEFTNRTVDLGDALGLMGRDLESTLAETPSWDARFAIIDRALIARLAQSKPASPAVASAWQSLEDSRGRVGIGALAADIGWSRKHLAAQFREQIGLSPKTMARILRFNHAIKLLRAGRAPGWAELAYRCGYYDQAHFIRDFGEFAGVTPSVYRGPMQAFAAASA